MNPLLLIAGAAAVVTGVCAVIKAFTGDEGDEAKVEAEGLAAPRSAEDTAERVPREAEEPAAPAGSARLVNPVDPPDDPEPDEEPADS